MSVLAGGVFNSATDDDLSDLRQLVEQIGSQSAGARTLPQTFDAATWAHLEETGLSRLTTGEGAGPAEAAVVLRGLGRHAVAVPVAETDLLAAWLASTAGVDVPAGALTVTVADGDRDGDRVTGTAHEVPWTRACSAALLVVRVDGRWQLSVAEPGELEITDGHNLAGEPRDTVGFELRSSTELPPEVVTELNRRGAWARCVQSIGALDAAAELTVAYTRDRVQFGRSLSKFQAVQHSLAGMAGDIERARVSAELAVSTATEHGFSSAATDYAVTLAKVTLGQVVPSVSTVAHQLHGAIGVTIEHELWTHTNRAYSWVGEFGSTRTHARRLGRVALSSTDGDGALWDVLTGTALDAWD